jgi:hypothetical protein
VVIESLASQGVNAGSLPIFLLANVVMASPVADINTCCVLGYHGATGSQTYSPQDFDTTGVFGSTIFDTSIAAHEVGEWMDDPLGGNPVQPWGHVGQVGGVSDEPRGGGSLDGTRRSQRNDAQRLQLPLAGVGVLLVVLWSAFHCGEWLVV